MVGVKPSNTGPTPPLPGIGRGQRLLKSGRILRLRSAVVEDTATQPPTQKVQGSAEKLKGPYQPPPPHDDDEEEPEHVRTVTVGKDDQARPSTSKLTGVPVEEVISEGNTEIDEDEYSGDDKDYIDEDKKGNDDKKELYITDDATYQDMKERDQLKPLVDEMRKNNKSAYYRKGKIVIR